MKDDDQLFSQEMADVRPLASDKRVVYLKSSGHPAAKGSAESEPERPENTFTTGFLDILPVDEPLEYKQSGVQQGVLDKLRAGKYPLEASLNFAQKAGRNLSSGVI
ncbi:DNA-nicking Smr family endonuclease [Ewingella americana]